MDFGILEKELEAAIAADEKYERENSAKFRAVDQKVASYDEFRLAIVFFVYVCIVSTPLFYT